MKAMLLLALAACSMATASHGATTGTSTSGPRGEGATGGDQGGGATPAGPDANGYVVVPNVIGKSMDDAQAMVKAAGFSQEAEASRPMECATPAPAEGLIKCQDPEPGKRVQKYTMLQVQVYRAQHFDGMIVRDQLRPVKGMTLAQAQAYLDKFKWTGKFAIEAPLYGYLDNCKLDTICGYDQDAGISLGEDLRVTMNKKPTIAMPPE